MIRIDQSEYRRLHARLQPTNASPLRDPFWQPASPAKPDGDVVQSQLCAPWDGHQHKAGMCWCPALNSFCISIAVHEQVKALASLLGWW